MISDKMAAKMNDQIKNELYSGHLYLAMAAYFSSIDLPGFANYFIVQEQEERFHAMKFFHYLVEQNQNVKIYGLDQPSQDFKSVENVIDLAWKHEQQVTKWLNELMALAVADKDYASQALLQWYITEQVEEESNMLGILKKIQMVGEKGAGIIMFDNHLASRKFNPPSK
jgi:ferritin